MSTVILKLNVETSHCLYCNTPIGKEEYVTIPSPYDVPYVAHKRCEEAKRDMEMLVDDLAVSAMQPKPRHKILRSPFK